MDGATVFAVAESVVFAGLAAALAVGNWDWRFAWGACALGAGVFGFLAVLNIWSGQPMDVARFAALSMVCVLSSFAVLAKKLF